MDELTLDLEKSVNQANLANIKIQKFEDEAKVRKEEIESLKSLMNEAVDEAADGFNSNMNF